MRDIERIEPFMNRLTELWRIHFPDWRFGQLMYNFFYEIGDPFYLEEDAFLKAFEEFCSRNKGASGSANSGGGDINSKS